MDPISPFSSAHCFIHHLFQGCVFTRDINKAILISDAMETGTVQVNSAPARGPDHFPFQVNALIDLFLVNAGLL
jgi:hypothetical protein